MEEEKTGNDIIIKTREQIEILQLANRIVAGVLDLLRSQIIPGVNTKKLDRVAEEYCRDHKGIPAFKGYRGFPASLCVSINEEVVHGIPSNKKVVRDGDIVSIDFGVKYLNFYGDAAITVPAGLISDEKKKLLDVTCEALEKGIAQVKIGNRINDISKAVQTYVEVNKFSVVKKFVGHGIGSSLHEGPEVPNFRSNGASPRIVEGMVLAIEPMVNVGSEKVKLLKDKWTVITVDHQPSAHFEHSVAATLNGPLVLSRF